MMQAGVFETRHSRFGDLLAGDAFLERIACGFKFTEGPIWLGDHLLFSDIGSSRIVRWTPLPEGPELRTFRFPSHLANGLTVDAMGRLLVCEGASRQLTRTELDGTVTVLAHTYQGKQLNAPNDVVVAADGSIYFSDPFWGHLFENPSGERVRLEDRELPFAAVFRLGPDGELTPAADDFEVPNGLALSPDGRTLYIDDSRRRHIRAFDVRADGSLANGRVFATLEAPERGAPDGMKVDQHGNIFCTGPGGVWVLGADGAILGRILPPEQPANLAWGDADLRTLYMTAETSLYRVRVNVPGVPVIAVAR